MKLKDLVTKRVTTIGPDDSLHVADGIMSLGGLRHLPVVSGGELVGILTHRDILRAPTTFFGFASDARAVLRALRVKDVMTTEVVTIGANATVQEAAARLLEHKVGSLPVLEGGALVGIVTTSDLLVAIVGAQAPDEPGMRAAAQESAPSVAAAGPGG
jgi:acetoin utilization protein AcuB